MIGLYFMVSFLMSCVGAICGIGGGVIIKPVLDFVAFADASVNSFLSGCTVLAMSSYNVIKGIFEKEHKAEHNLTSFLALGASVGGIVGKQLMSFVLERTAKSELLEKAQAIELIGITAAVLIYTLFQQRIQPRKINNKAVGIFIGFFLGFLSAFLGIGGGPVNLIALYYLFSMDAKTAAQNSLCMIFLSQSASLFTAIATGTIPPIQFSFLITMIVGGFFGGVVGRTFRKRISANTIEKLFIGILVLIIAISIRNVLD